MAARKLDHLAYGRAADWRPFLVLAGIQRIRMQGTWRYVTACPSCRRPAAFLVVRRYREPAYCRRCRPRYLPPLLGLAAFANAQAQLLPVTRYHPLLLPLLRALGRLLAAPAPDLVSLLSVLNSPALRPEYLTPPRPYRSRIPALRNGRAWSGLTAEARCHLSVVAQSLHPSQFLVTDSDGTQ